MSVCKQVTMRELRKYNVDIACLSKVRIPDSGHSAINVPGEEAFYHLYHIGVVDNIGRHGVAIALGEAIQAALFGHAIWRKDWVKCLVSSHRTLEPGVSLSETWST